ncbi:unnamed protein product [Leptosia nina]|uniref:Uncharacterized protein n=1 Tax=Leptosia nina TaxID=320188 RepID=A0AAV1K2F6_9NEOP
MNRFQRRFYSYPRKDELKCKEKDVEEVLAPRFRRNTLRSEIPMTNRCCSISPVVVDAEQSTEAVTEDEYQNLLIEQYGFDPRNLDTIDHMKELKKIICGSSPKTEGSQCNPYEEPVPSCVGPECDLQWQDVDNTDDIDKFLNAEKNEGYTCKEIEISEVPKIKVIAEKFMKYKKDNIEVRKLDEKVVCIEYDVYKKKTNHKQINPEPIQKLRTYFSIRPDFKDTHIPSSVKLKYKVASEDLKKMNDKEVEIIDGKISENQPYLDDLRNVLKRKQASFERKNRTSLDLMSLYKMAKRNITTVEDNFDLLSKAELDDIKELITKNCVSSVHGISRRTIKSEKENESRREKTIDVVSESIFAELLRNTK